MNMLSPLQTELLQNLVTFKQLTIPQFAKLNEGSSEQSIRRALDKLLKRRKPLINRVEFKKVSHFGKLSYVHSVTKLGVSRLVELGKSIPTEETFTPANPKLTTDYFHRTRTIDFHIQLSECVKLKGMRLLFSSHYFMVRKHYKGFISLNRIAYQGGKNIIPDSIYAIGADDSSRFLLFELHNGKDTGRIVEQVEQHAIVLTGLYTHIKFRIPKDKFYYILVVFEERSAMEGVITILNKTNRYRNIVSFFLFKHISELGDNLFSNWLTLDGLTINISI